VLEMSKAIRSDPSPSPALGQDLQGSSDCAYTAWNTPHPPSAPHPTATLSKGADEGQGTCRPLGNSGLRRVISEGAKVQKSCSFSRSLARPKVLPLGSLTTVTAGQKQG
jgi:hypothetical protein